MMNLSVSNETEININENGNMLLKYYMRTYRERFDKIFLFYQIGIFLNIFYLLYFVR